MIESAVTQIILLNGTSSSGKTTVGKLLQQALRDPEWLFLSIDDALGKFPKHAFETKEKFSRNVLKTVPGFHRSVASFAKQELPIIVDHVFQEQGWLEDYKKATYGLKTIYVGLKCPIEVLEERERNRGDRKLGLARMQYPKVHRGLAYDLEFDTNTLGADACVDRIIKVLNF